MKQVQQAIWSSCKGAIGDRSSRAAPPYCIAALHRWRVGGAFRFDGISPYRFALLAMLVGSSLAHMQVAAQVFGPGGTRVDGETFLFVPTGYNDLVIIPIDFGREIVAQEDMYRSAELCRDVQIAHFWPSKGQEEAALAANTVRVARLGDDVDAVRDPNDLFATNDVLLDDFRQDDSGLHISYFYGARFIESRDRYDFTHLSPHNSSWSIGDTILNTRVNSVWAGPEVGLSTSFTVGRLELGSRFSSMFAYSDRRYRQYGSVGGTRPGQVNSPLLIPTVTFSYAADEDSFAYAGELRLSANYWLSNNSRLSAVWSNTYLSAVYASYNQVEHGITPHGAMGFRPENGQDAWLDSLQLSLIVSR